MKRKIKNASIKKSLLKKTYGTDLNPDYTHYYGSKIGSKIANLRHKADKLMRTKGKRSEIIKIEREITRLINLAES